MCRIYSENDRFWARILIQKCLSDNNAANLFAYFDHAKDSTIWNFLKVCADTFSNGMCWRLGSERNVSFYFDVSHTQITSLSRLEAQSMIT